MLSLQAKAAYEENELRRRRLLYGFVPSNVFPANVAVFDLDFAHNQFFGGTQPLVMNNTNDGRFLRQQISNTQPSYVENADGSLSTFTSTQCIRFGTRGLALAGDRQNRILQSRDFTNAAWVKSNCTALKNQIGRTGVANSASQITVTADGATLTQAITVTSLLLRGYVDIKRLSGSGTCSMSMDGGATNTVLDLTKPILNGICRPSIPTQTLANPTVVFTFSTSGDVWLLDFAELSDGGEAEYEPVSTVAASVKGWRDRASAFTTDAGPLANWLLTEPVQVMYFEYAQRQNGAICASDADLQITSNGVNGFGAGTTLTTNTPNFSPDARLNVINKGLCWRSPTVSGACLNGGAVAVGAGSTRDGLGTHWDWGTNGAGNLHMRGSIRRMWFGTVIPSDDVAKAFTT